MPNPMSIDERARDLHYMLIEDGVIVDESPRDNHGTREALIAAIRAAVEQEREACAGVADEEYALNYKFACEFRANQAYGAESHHTYLADSAKDIAFAIRSRTTPPAGEEQGDRCPHCNVVCDTWFSRTEPMGDFCTNCGEER